MTPSVFAPGGPLSKWIWIELIGFDNVAPDYGVGDYLARAGYVPDGVSLLLYSAGFAFRHQPLDAERPLCVCEQSYAGHPYSSERQRQNWTNWQLRGLIAELHARGIQVYLSIFNSYSYTDDAGNLVPDEYLADKPYLDEVTREGRRNGGSLAMLKHLADGSLFEDAFQPRVVQALQDYAFDGLQIADGVSSPRLMLQEGDYSDDTVAQFLDITGTALPEGLLRQADGDPDAIRARADWIWQRQRGAWITFYTRRWALFYDKYVQRLRAAGKQAIFNSAWTRDPFEALYRYGIDYRLAARSGIAGCMVEDVSAGLSILSARDNGYLMTDAQRRRLHYEYLTALMFNRAAMPALRITPLAGIHDTMEQWGVLEHMPTAMTRNVMTNLNTFIHTAEGLRPVTDGPFFCLADGLSAADWGFIKRNWEIGYTAGAQRTAGATVIWSDARLDAELEAFIATRRTPSHRLVSELLYAGAPLYSVARIEDLGTLDGPILVTNPDLLPAAERQAVAAYDCGPVLYVGSGALPDDVQAFVSEQNTFGGAWLAGKGAGAAQSPETIRNDAVYPFDPQTGEEAVRGLWTHPLAFAPLSEAFFRAGAAAITRVSGAPVVTLDSGEPAPVCKYIAVQIAVDTWRVFIGNDDYYYNHPMLDMRREIKHVTCLTKYPGYKVDFHQTLFTVRIPGRGMEAFEVVL